MTKQDFIKSLEIRVGDEPYFVRLYGLILVERHAYDKASRPGSLPGDFAHWKERQGERKGFEMCLRLERYTDRQINEIHDKIIDHINSVK